jgi:catechol 2,3-dioxygenase-like lactoylglutathione lyase family enzyme
LPPLKGGGLHHIAFEVDDFDATLARFRNKKIGVLQGGNWNGRFEYAYLDTEAGLSTIAEIYTPLSEGGEFPPPERTYP